MNKTASRLVMVASLVALAACAPKRKVEDIPPPPVQQGEATPDANADKPLPGSQADFVASVTADRVYFDTDKFDIDEEDQAVLRSQASWLARYPTKRVTIEGHCDERGTRDYNIALGDRRANAAKNFLASLGVDSARISTISYGKERPDAMGSDEASWARNRRAVTVTVQ
ncbi:MAG: peptidoglycan-associated lipoprotein Pal [Sphingomonadaceae bacterium]|uniref:peptidoglycan-associated lipoprotein Pal n=1 Tax=Aquisediminimonas profunda TaxID=1550733 RepID=UPI001FEC1E37|nr:peptidoglycan-associated lipoprotein Pal [Aquisediminimonas profunda]